MPEIAEVETVRNVLKRKVLNKKIKNINIIYPKMIESDLNEFKNNMINSKFIDIKRIGKWLIFDLDNDYCMISHLRMEGKYFVKKIDDEINKHEHIIFTFEDDSQLRYHDTRKFGRMSLVLKNNLLDIECIKKQGYEPLSDNLTCEYLYDKVHNKKLPIKTLLLDQTIISGLGNIYADEVLFLSMINPNKKGIELIKDECKRIISSSNQIIKKAILEGGTTIRSYTSSLGVTGNYQNYLKVHKKEGEKCSKCGCEIKKIKIGGRSTYFCPSCQK